MVPGTGSADPSFPRRLIIISIFPHQYDPNYLGLLTAGTVNAPTRVQSPTSLLISSEKGWNPISCWQYI